MTILQPGQHWEGLDIVNNDSFRSRTKPKPPTLEEEFFSKAIYAAEMCQRQGWAVTPETMQMVNEDLRSAPLSDLLATDKFQNALHARGIPMTTKSGLSPRQLTAIAVYLDMSTPATHTQKLRMAGVTSREWEGWWRQPAFAARMSEMMEDVTRMNTPVAEQRLAQAVDAGAPWAIQFALAMNRRFDPRAETADPTVALREIFDILDEILDADTLHRLDERLRAKREGRPAEVQVVRIAASSPAADTLDHHDNNA